MSIDYITSRQCYTQGRDPPSPVSIPHEDWIAPKNKHRESIYDEERENGRNISPLDSRRITPTLHASLVSEILNLRRQLEAKDEFINHLEVALQATKSENELLEVRLAASARDVRSGQWEAGKVQTHLEELADGLIKERDSVTISNQELREKLDLVTKKSRDQERDFAAWQQDWEAERQQWDKERSQLERSLLVTEDRLRAVVDEFSSHHVEEPEQHVNLEGDLQANSGSNDSGLGHATGASSTYSNTTPKHSRSMSALSSRSNASSVRMPTRGGHGYTLADELAQEEEDDHGSDSSDDQQDEDLLDRPLTELADAIANSQTIRGHDAATGYSASYVEAKSNDQASVSTKYDDRRDSKTQGKTVHFEEAVRQQAETMVAEILQRGVEDSVSAEVQKSSNVKPVYRSFGTQTDERLSRTTDQESVPLDIPLIAIHPPLTAPSTPKASVLPPATRNAVCQTDAVMTPSTLQYSRQTTSTGVQTEETLVYEQKVAPMTSVLPQQSYDPVQNDLRAEHRSLSNQFTSILPRKPDLLRFQTAPADLTNTGKNFRALSLKVIELPRPVLLPSPAQLEQDAAAGSVHRNRSNELKQSRSINPLSFQEYYADSDTEPFDFENRVSPPEDVFVSRPLMSRKGSLKPVSFPMTVPEDSEASPHRDWRPIAPRTSSRDGNTKMTSGGNGNPAEPQHSRTDSRETQASSIFSASSQPPPIPVPTRSSSKMYSDTFNDSRPTTARGQESPTNRRTSRKPYSLRRPASGIRKVQSAGAMRVQKNSPIMKRRNTPLLAPIRASIYENVGQTQFLLADNLPTAASKASTPTNNLEHSVASSTLQDEQNAEDESADNTLVDAVASTMVGGWMWKYVNSAKNGDVRHKRWVWLSPYERTIMWSSKQPTTGAALMGKTGRKLQIKSILDVKDNNPPPKGQTTNTVFDRSIMVLTPARALKLTAPSRESHYHWLMALSFLANPTGMPPQVARVPELEIYAAQDRVAQQPITNPVIEKSINKAQVRNFSDPPKTLSLKASLSSMVTHKEHDTQSLFSRQDSFDQPQMRPLESYNRHSRKRSNTGPSRFNPSIRSSRSIASIVSPALSSTTFPRSRRGSLAVPVTNESMRPDTGMTSPRPGTAADQEPGTVRMTAFVDTVYRESALHAPLPPPAPSSASSKSVSHVPVMRPRRNSQLSTTTMEKRRSGRVFDDDEGGGLFRGF